LQQPGFFSRELVRGRAGTVNRGDRAAMLDYFDPISGVVIDAGRRFVGHSAIGPWSDGEFLGAKGRVSSKAASKVGNVVTVIGDWKSAAYTGPTKFVFVLDGERITELHLG